MIASHATSVVAVVWLLLCLTTFSLFALPFPEILPVGKDRGKWVVVVAILIWALQFHSVKNAVAEIRQGKAVGAPKIYAVWSMVAALGVFLATNAIILNAKSG